MQILQNVNVFDTITSATIILKLLNLVKHTIYKFLLNILRVRYEAESNLHYFKWLRREVTDDEKNSNLHLWNETISGYLQPFFHPNIYLPKSSKRRTKWMFQSHYIKSDENKTCYTIEFVIITNFVFKVTF